ncbi:hypothetical protein L6250_03295 [Candidatus Parcubacteria bacterium]|nr:hypothetical protein [Candidatus Parcubacteria bacterium]
MDNPISSAPQDLSQITTPPLSQSEDQLLKYYRDYTVLIILYAIFFNGFLLTSVFFFPEIITPPLNHLAAILLGSITIGVGYLTVKHELIASFRSGLGTQLALWGSLIVFVILSVFTKGGLPKGLALNSKIYLTGKKAKISGSLAIILGCLAVLWGNAGIIKTTYESDSTKYTSFQLDDSERKELNTSCYMSIVPKSAVVTNPGSGNNCTSNITMPDTTIPYVKVVAISDSQGLTVREAAYSGKTTIDQEFKDAGNTKYNSQVIENVSLGGFNSYLLKYTDGVSNSRSYYVEVSDSKDYIADSKKVVGFFINGYDNNPQTDVFTKYLDLFLVNLKFK